MPRLATFVLALAALGAPWSRAHAWFVTVDGVPNPFDESGAATEVVIDPAGHVIAGGYVADPMPFDRGFSTFFTKRDGGTGKELWRQRLGPGVMPNVNIVPPRGVGLDASGDVVAGASFRRTVDGFLGIGAVKLDGATGAVEWLASTVGTGQGGGARDAALDAGGDLVVVGERDTNPHPGLFNHNFTVVKFAGAGGAVLWERDLPGADSPHDPDTDGYGSAVGVTVDGNGDVLAVGILELTTHPQAFVVVKLDGATGADAWPAPVTLGSGYGAFVATLPSDDVVAVDSAGQVARLSGADGTVVWQAAVPGSGGSALGRSGVVVDPAGDVLVVGRTAGSDVVVTKLAGATGAQTWQSVVPGLGGAGGGSPTDMVLDPGGDVVVAAGLATASTGTGVAVLRLDGATGAVLSRQLASGSRHGSGDDTFDESGGIALGPDGRVAIAAGVVDLTDSEDTDFAVLQLSGRLAGQALIVRQTGAHVLTLRSRDPNLLAVPPGGPGDPTIDGAVLEIRNPTSAESSTIPLPAALWRSVDAVDPAVQRYRYADRALAAGPCKAITVKNARVLKVKCTGPLPGLTLDEPSQGALAVRLTLGTGARSHCMEFTGDSDMPGYFKSTSSPPPAACD